MYVSWAGHDVRGCGHAPHVACRSIKFGLERAKQNDIVLVDGSREYFYTACSQDGTALFVTRNITIRGHNGVPTIGCRTFVSSNNVIVVNTVPSLKITMLNLEVHNASLLIANTETIITSCVFVNAALETSFSNCDSIFLYIDTSQFYRRTYCEFASDCYNLFHTRIHCKQIVTHLTRVQSYDEAFLIDALDSSQIVVAEATFTKKLEQETGVNALNITLPSHYGRLTITNSSFYDLVHLDPIYSAINIEAAALRVESRYNRGNVAPLDVVVNISDSGFYRNERAVSITRRFRYVIIERCVFDSNRAMHAAAALRLAMTNDTVMLVTDTHFRQNAAGENWHKTIPGWFECRDNQLRLNHSLINGVISLVGKGGAVRIQKGNVTFKNCHFSNNTALLLGGAMFVDRSGHAEIIDTKFENSPVKHHALQGEFFYSTGSVTIRNVKFIVHSAEDHLSILRHSGEHWSLNVERMWFECPVGHSLMMVNTTSHKIDHGVGLIRSHKLDQMYYYCQTCGNKQYSVDKGSLNYTLTDNTTEYYTLLINGEQPFKRHSVSFQYSNITCQDCPYGGDCENGLRAVANFWGYRHQNSVAFQHCPQDYCCSTTMCSAINECEQYRHGRLCGQCISGYSEALFSSKCVPDSTCTHNNWLVPFTLIMGLIYASFLVFQRDVRLFLSSWKEDYDRCVVYFGRRREENTVHNTQISTELTTYQTNIYDADEDIDMSQNTDSLQQQSEGLADKLEGDAVMAEVAVTTEQSSYLIILFYYFQDALLLHINTVYTKSISKLEKQVKALLIGLFRFRLDFYQFFDDICLFPGMQPITKVFFKTFFVFYIVILFGMLYSLSRVYCFIKKKRVGIEIHKVDKQKKAMLSKLASGFVLALLFTYQKMATATFKLLNCVPVADSSVLLLDGTEECFQPWQYGVMAYAFTCMVPFSLILMLGPPLIKRKKISLTGFFVGCIFPLPVLIVWLIKHHTGTGRLHSIGPATEAVLQLLQGPFKDTGSKRLAGQLCWSGMLLARRLILFLCFTFINDVLVRLLCMLGVCFIILMHHMYIRPYKSPAGNLAGAISAAALLVVGAINLLRASFEAAEYVPRGPYQTLMEVCDGLENTLVMWLPLAGMCILLMWLIARTTLFICSRIALKSSK